MMNITDHQERILLEKWRCLSTQNKQKLLSVLEQINQEENNNIKPEISPLGQKLRKIREQIIASGIPLLTADQINQEISESRRNYD